MAVVVLTPPFWAAVGKAAAAIGGFFTANAVPIAGAAAVVGGGAIIANEMTKAEEDAAAREQAGATTDVCATCADNPCAHLAGGVPGSKYRGGAHSAMTQPIGDGLDSHHMPADSISPLTRAMSPAIQMDQRDHRRTNSYGGRAQTNAVLAGQQNLINSGNFVAAQAIDVAEVLAKFPGKYDAAIAQMEAYTACLKRNGIIQ